MFVNRKMQLNLIQVMIKWSLEWKFASQKFNFYYHGSFSKLLCIIFQVFHNSSKFIYVLCVVSSQTQTWLETLSKNNFLTIFNWIKVLLDDVIKLKNMMMPLSAQTFHQMMVLFGKERLQLVSGEIKNCY